MPCSASVPCYALPCLEIMPCPAAECMLQNTILGNLVHLSPSSALVIPLSRTLPGLFFCRWLLGCICSRPLLYHDTALGLRATRPIRRLLARPSSQGRHRFGSLLVPVKCVPAKQMQTAVRLEPYHMVAVPDMVPGTVTDMVPDWAPYLLPYVVPFLL